VLVCWFYSDGEVGYCCFPNCFGSWDLSLPFVQTEKSMSGYIDLMELLCVVMCFGYPGLPSHISSCVYSWNLMLTVVGSMLTEDDYSQSKHVAP
jgi:hypothetical protein